jgi:cytochrome c-type biogenesis protein CcsB
MLLLIYVAGLATATFIEKHMGTRAAGMLIYYSPLFFFLQFLLVVNFILIVFHRRFIQKKKWAVLAIHCALVVILAGALTTFLFGKEGQVHIREGEKTDKMVMHTSKGVKTETLPFVLELVDFRLIRYPGSQSPSSYESDLLIHVDGEVREAKVYMNNILDVKGYRFFQASYDRDEAGTVLSVNRDVAGRIVTYSGYLLLLAGFLLMFFMPGSHFRRLQRQLKEVRKSLPVTVFLLMIATFGGHAQTVIPAEHAARFGALPVQFRGRVMPMNTFSSEILRKVHKEQTLGNLNSDQFLLGFLAMPQTWTQVPLVALPAGEYAAYGSFFDGQGNYTLLPRLQEIYHRPADTRTASEKELIKLDERVNILYRLLNHSMPGIFPDSVQTFERYLAEVQQALSSGDWSKADEALKEIDGAYLIRPEKLKAELFYNRIDLFNRVKVGYFIAGGLLLVIALMQLLHAKRWQRNAAAVLAGCIGLSFLCHTFGMGMRWYIAGYAPWSNSYETMVYVSWATVLAGLIFGRKNVLTRALAALFGGVILFVAALNWMDPQINTLAPVLKSPWLMFHVAVIVAAYGFFGIGFLLGVTNLSIMAFAGNGSRLSRYVEELSIINNLSLLAGLVLMTAGTFLGAVWANESWGRYWGWDPKETWALITVVVYSVTTHLHLVKKWHSLWLFNLLSVFSFASVLMTFLGVNYLFSGMHSYGQDSGLSSVFIYILIAFTALGVLGVLSKIKTFNK